jgi:hypothetical protein
MEITKKPLLRTVAAKKEFSAIKIRHEQNSSIILTGSKGLNIFLC